MEPIKSEFDGIWVHHSEGGKKEWQITVIGSSFTAKCIKFVPNSPNVPPKCAWFNSPYEFSGAVNGRELSGTWNTHPALPPGEEMVNPPGPYLSPKALPMKASLSAEGKELQVQFFQHGTLNLRQWTSGQWRDQTWIKIKN